MKKALLLMMVWMLAAGAALAGPPPANVNFSSERGVPFTLVLDGRLLTRGPARQVHVDLLAPGQHWADFTIPVGRGRAVQFRSRVWLEAGYETSYVLITRQGRPPVLRQVGALALVDPNCGEPSYGNGGYGQGQGGQYGNNSGYQNGAYGQNQGNYAGNQGGYGGGNGNYNQGNSGYGNGAPSGGSYNNGGSYPGSAVSSYRAMQGQDVEALLQAIRQRSFEATKLSTAKEALSESSIRAEDLKRLLRSMTFEASRVELAKFAYTHVMDRQNFYRVYEAFDFDTSIQEVQQAIGVPQG